MKKHFLNIPAVYNFGTKWIGHLPLSLSYSLAAVLADTSYLFYRSAVKDVTENLQTVFPHASRQEITTLVKRLFRNYAKYLVDYGRFTYLGGDALLDAIVYFDGKDNLTRAIEFGKGIILLTAHFGNWELGGLFLRHYGLKVNVLTIEDRNTKIDEARKRYRERHGVQTITVGNSPLSTLDLIKVLSEREVVAMLIDRYREGLDALPVRFFQREAFFPRGPFTLSRLTGAPIIVAFVVREHDGYRGVMEGPLVVEKEEDEQNVSETVVKIFERFIVKYPDQWYNFTHI